MKNTIGARFWD